jgi:hypothetical protein
MNTIWAVFDHMAGTCVSVSNVGGHNHTAIGFYSHYVV